MAGVSYSFRLRYESTTLYFGEGSVRRLAPHLRGARRAVVVTGRSSARASGALGDVEALLSELGVEREVFSDVSPNPWESQADRLAEFIKDFNADAVIAIGGGSVIDTAKVATVVASGGGRARDYVLGAREPSPRIPLLAVNTTHGTGTEVDRYAVVTFDDSREKRGASIRYPDASADDPRYTLTLDRAQTVYTSLDAFYHSYESATLRSTTPFVQSMAREAAEIISSTLPELLESPRSVELRARALYASMIAGIAIDSGLTHLVHAVEHAASGLQPKLPHGAGLAMFGPRVAYYTHMAAPELSAVVLRAVGAQVGPAGGEAAAAERAVREFQSSVGFEERLGDYGLGRDDVPRLVEYAHRRLSYLYSEAPFDVSEEIVRDVVESAL